MRYLWLSLSMLLLTSCVPFAGWQMYEAVETHKKIRAYDQSVEQGQAPARSLIWDCNQTAMTRRSPKNDGSWELDPAVRAQCFWDQGWEQESVATQEVPFGTWRRVSPQ